ncbi:hypothetical protein Phi13:2_gp014 [Cellulophaga phage phi13:2]|uniref:Uncharacterized protein n=2 Tax=Baltivirus TaxID=2946816 RepID=R9ZYV3_9CAUD|nr:hypothetical protein Phi18:3_gp017 [Cellulophaga phage phi18:3]YP_008242039.1 hypothetical protein Phi13:2_gp014 [Cellulophaga phage phi13:2]AGO48529.1 hypothetical protein Phi18:3_gp017 [Cellulophaga phage phi18:3]AGO49624.1 hypothetical protein Phi13:2_gp014 [Cellulophaga phage phi13:2]
MKTNHGEWITTLDFEKLYTDIRVKLNSVNKSLEYLQKKIEIDRKTIYNIRHCKFIRMETFFKIINWLDVGAENYIIKKYIRNKPKEKTITELWN